jgi:hypothetical protein
LSRCTFIKPGGDRCGSIAMKGYPTCYGHRPDLAEERRRNASKGGKRGGRGRSQTELTDIKTRLSDLADDVLAGKVDKGVAAVASQVLNVYLRAVSVELKAREQMELIERLEALDEALGHQSTRGGRYGA